MFLTYPADRALKFALRNDYVEELWKSQLCDIRTK